MKKRKTYEISVIDKTYSKIISDETKFYTSDTALELGFELKETEYTFESAEIVLLNIDDRSLVTRPVAKSLDSFTYELDDDIITHYGEWRCQLRFEQTGEIYVSSPVKFRIENDLSNERPPQLSDVQSWVSLKRYADKLTDELKQAVFSVEGIEDTFNENETVRQITFEANESERDETFNANEDIRKVQELEREKAEGSRESAESNRVSAEEQRKIDHANRSAELAGKADKKQEDWLYPTITNANADSTSRPRFFKDDFGVVHLSGKINNITGNRQILFALPSGYRPYYSQGFACVTGGGTFGYASVGNAGPVSLIVGNVSYMLMDGITFKAER